MPIPGGLSVPGAEPAPHRPHGLRGGEDHHVREVPGEQLETFQGEKNI